MELSSIRENWLYIVGIISGGHFLSHFYILAFPPVFPAWKAEFGLSNTELGLIMSASLVASLFQVPVGNLVDRVGAKWIFVTGVLVTSTGVFLLGFADSYLSILTLAVLSGIGQVSFHPSDYAMIDTVTSTETKGKGFSIHMFSGYIGFAAAPVVVGSITVFSSWQAAMFIVGGAGILYALFALIALTPVYREELEERRSKTETTALGSYISQFTAFLKPTLLIVFLFFASFTTAVKGIQTFTTVGLVDSFSYAESTGNTALTLYFASAAGGILVGGILADRYNAERIIINTLMFSATILVLGTFFLFQIGILVTLGTFAAVGFFAGIIYPSRDQLISRFSADGSTGTSFGFVYTGTTIGGLFSPPILGWLIDLTAPWFAFIFIAISIVLGILLILLLTNGDMIRAVHPAPSDD